MRDPKMTKAKNVTGFLILKSNTQLAHIVSDRSVIIFSVPSNHNVLWWSGVIKKKNFSPLFFYQSKLRSCDQYQSLIHPRTCWNLNDLILADYDDAYVWKYAKYANYAMYAKYADMQMCNRSKICRICKTKPTKPTKLNIHT